MNVIREYDRADGAQLRQLWSEVGFRLIADDDDGLTRFSDRNPGLFLVAEGTPARSSARPWAPRQTVHARCSRLNGCPLCQKLRGSAAQRRVTEREHLSRSRAAWGDYDMPGPPLVTTATMSSRVPNEEDF